MFMGIARSTCRYACALTLGLLFNALLFTTLWRVTATTVESTAVVATRIEFTRLRSDAQTTSPHENESPQLALVDVPRVPPLELALTAVAPDALPLMAPAIDIHVAFNDAGSALAYESEVIAILRIPPSYPRPARQARIQGYVTMEVGISPEGTVTEVTVVDTAPPRMFDIAAMDAMKRWKFRPKLVNGIAVSQRAHQTIEFKIE